MRGQEPEKDKSQRYLITYADLMNLLLILFIVLFCTSTKDVVKATAVMNAIQEGFTGAAATSSDGGAGGGAGSAANGEASASSDYSDFYEHLIGLIDEKGLGEKVDITAANNQVVITLKDNVLFERSKADLGPEAVNLLTNVAELLKKIKFGQLIIEGHTDSDPIHTAEFHDNVELSLIRAYNVSKIFTNCGIDSKKVLPVGYGENYPVAPNDTPENKAKNRRVVITILRKPLTPADESISKEDIIKKFSSSGSPSSAPAGGSANSSSGGSSSGSK